MKSTTYRITLSDGKRCGIESTSAASAMEEALRRYQGRTVVECYSGLKPEDVEAMRRVDSTKKPIAGFIQHDIPAHEAVPVGTTYQHTKREDHTLPMFSETAIRTESKKALDRASARTLK